MQKVLIFAPEDKGGPAAMIGSALNAAGYTVMRSSLDRGARGIDMLCGAFEGRPPDIMVADLSTAPDCLPLRHALRMLQSAWGEEMPRPVCLGLLDPRHLAHPDWLPNLDDFLLPPYTSQEILARIEMLLFRKRHVRSGDTLPLGEITLDLTGGRVLDAAGGVLPLTPREYDLLRFLATHRGKFFARDRLLDMVWGVDFDGGERTVDIHIRRLRAKLPPSVGGLLDTRRGIGYGFVPS